MAFGGLGARIIVDDLKVGQPAMPTQHQRFHRARDHARSPAKIGLLFIIVERPRHRNSTATARDGSQCQRRGREFRQNQTRIGHAS